VTITGAAMSGKTELLRAIAASLRAADGLEVLTVLAGSRPEEASSWKETEVDLHATVALPAAPEARARAVEGAVEAGRRMAARGQDVAVLIDTLDGLDRGVVRRSLGAARNLTESGSLTVIATAAAPIGGETTVIALDRAQAAAGQYPALDTQGSGTIKAELLS
jgi:transcription termination factor Rho